MTLTAWTFVVAHWPWIVAGTHTVFAGVGYLLGWRKSQHDLELVKLQVEKLRIEVSQAKLDVETKSVAQMVLIVTDARKKHAGTQNLAFSLEDLWGEIGEPYALRLHAALNQLVADKRAKRDAAGDWLIDPV